MSKQQAELIDLPEEDERPRISLSKICSPKIVILLIASTYFVSLNIYNYIQKPPEEVKDFKSDFWGDFWKMAEQMYGYMALCVVCFVILVFLIRSNDQYQLDRLEKVRKEEQAKEEEARQKQKEREERILRKMEQEEREQTLRQAQIASRND